MQVAQIDPWTFHIQKPSAFNKYICSCVSLRNLFQTFNGMNHSNVANVSRKYVEQAILFAASRGNFVSGQ